MMRPDDKLRAVAACGSATEVHGFSWQERSVVIARLHHALRACRCWTANYRPLGCFGVEYVFEVDLDAVVELYCGLIEAGLEISQASHRTLTELCALRGYGRALHGRPPASPPALMIRLKVAFAEMEAAEPAECDGGVAALT